MAKEEKNGTPKMGPWAKFMHWYESYKGKRVVGVVYSVGASVVIIGALFKILHWPGASTVLMIGMFTEAFLFIIGALDKPHPEFNWSNVFPQLLEYGTDPLILEAKANQARPTLLGAGVEGEAIPAVNMASASAAVAAAAPAAAVNVTAAPKINMPAFEEKDVEALQKGILDLAKTATQLSELGKVATATTQLSAKLEAAGDAAEQFAASQAGLLATSGKLDEAYQTAEANMQQAANTTKTFAQGMDSVGAKLSSLNSIYELQINALQGQVEITKAQTESLKQVSGSLQNIETNATEAKHSHEAYAAGVKKLAAQVADLNSIYGNMLNALA